MVHDIVSRCPRTCGRGSGAASIVSYLLGITHVDPLRYNLFFERFLNLERQDPPDIDVDFPWDEREKALRYVFERYAGRAGMVADHVTFRDRSALREPAKALGFSREEIDRFVRFARFGEAERIPAALRRVAARLRGFPRHLGTHPGGVVITPRPITDYTHVQDSPLGWPVIAWEKDGTEDAGLVKIDLLGNRSLGVLRDCIGSVNAKLAAPAAGARSCAPRCKCGRLDPPAVVTWEGLDPLDDPATQALVAGGGTLGVFYVESPATRQLLAKMRRGDFEHLVIASSIIRPAANRFIREFVRRLHGAGYPPLHPRLEETLRETYGIMVYQEDVSRVAIDLAGFSAGEADRLRKVLTKKDRELRLAAFRERFFARGAARGVSPEVLEKVWEMILSFDGYSFCKSHSASYAVVSFKLAWMKRFHPLEFFAAVINNGGGYYTRQTYLERVPPRRLPAAPPRRQRQPLGHTVETERADVSADAALCRPAASARRRPRRRACAWGWGSCGTSSGGSPTASWKSGRGGAPSPTWPTCCGASRRGCRRCGCSSSRARWTPSPTGSPAPQLFWAFLRAEEGRDAAGRGRARGGRCGGGGLFLCPPVPAWIGDYSPARKLLDEVRTLGLLVSRHPVSVFRRRIVAVARREGFRRLVSSRRLPGLVGRRVSLAGLLVTGKEVPTRRREPMIFVSFEDEHSIYETVLFPRAFREFHPVLDGGGVFLLSGRVQDDLGALGVHVDRVVRVSREGSGLAAAGVYGGPPPGSAGAARVAHASSP